MCSCARCPACGRDFFLWPRLPPKCRKRALAEVPTLYNNLTRGGRDALQSTCFLSTGADKSCGWQLAAPQGFTLLPICLAGPWGAGEQEAGRELGLHFVPYRGGCTLRAQPNARPTRAQQRRRGCYRCCLPGPVIIAVFSPEQPCPLKEAEGRGITCPTVPACLSATTGAGTGVATTLVTVWAK